jgi:hypothetical protein
LVDLDEIFALFKGAAEKLPLFHIYSFLKVQKVSLQHQGPGL